MKVLLVKIAALAAIFVEAASKTTISIESALPDITEKVQTFLVKLKSSNSTVELPKEGLNFTIKDRDGTSLNFPITLEEIATESVATVTNLIYADIKALKLNLSVTITGAEFDLMTPMPWIPMLYDQATNFNYTYEASTSYVNVLKGPIAVGTISLSTTDGKRTKVQPMGSATLDLMSDGSTTPFTTVMATVDQLSGAATISKPSPAVIEYIDGHKDFRTSVAGDSTAAASDASSIKLCSGTFKKPYMVVMKGDETQGQLHVAYQGNPCDNVEPVVVQAVVDDNPAQNVTNNVLTLNASSIMSENTGHYDPATMKGPTIQLMSLEPGRIMQRAGDNVDIYYVDADAMSVIVSGYKALYVANEMADVTVYASFNKAPEGSTFYPAATHSPNITVAETARSSTTDMQIHANTNETLDLLPVLNKGQTDQVITPTITAWTTLDGQNVNLGTYHDNFTTQVLDVGSANNVSKSIMAIESGSCGIEFNLEYIRTDPVLEGQCIVFMSNGMNTTLNNTLFTQGATDLDGRTQLLLKYTMPAVRGQTVTYITCSYWLNAVQFFYWTKSFGDGVTFADYAENPITTDVDMTDGNITQYINDTVKQTAVDGCFGTSYNPLVEIICNNDRTVSLYGDGMTWKYSAYNSTDVDYTSSTNLTTVITETCGSAAILPAALLIALVSIFNIFK